MLKFYIINIVVVIINLVSTLKGEENEKKLFYTIDLKKEIAGTTWLYIKDGFSEAKLKNANAIIIHMNTYGGEVLYADSIRTKILNSTTPVYVFIDNNAASAGALIAIACDKIFMRSGASIGAATVVNQTGERMPDKYQSYMRATMRATAESHGKDTLINGKDTTYRWKRNPLIAEAMVDDRTVIPNIIDSGKTLTFTALEASQNGYCDAIAENIDDVIQNQLLVHNYEIASYMPSQWDEIKGFLMSSVFQSILIMFIIGGIYFELQTPGIGFPLGVSILASILYFAPLYMDGLAANWEIIIFIIGLVLIAVELFVIPGFGISGISGIGLVITGLTLSLLNNVDFNFEPVKQGAVGSALLTVIAGTTLAIGLVIYLSTRIGSKGILKDMALETSLDNASGYIGVPMEAKLLIGKDGIAATVLRLSGKVEIESKIYDAISEDGFIEKGTKIKVIRYETGQVYVMKIV